MRRLLHASSRTRAWLRALYHAARRWNWPPPIDATAVLARLAQSRKDVFFVQIGAYDGVAGDPIYALAMRHGWAGIAIEPVRGSYARLVEHYRSRPEVICENVAIAEREGERELFRLRDTEDPLPAWRYQVASLRRDVLAAHRREFPQIDEYIMAETVPCTTLGALLAKHGVQRVNILVVDVEGYEDAILATVDFARVRPEVILFEHKHLTRRAHKKTRRLLESQGYRTFVAAAEEADTLAVLSESSLLCEPTVPISQA